MWKNRCALRFQVLWESSFLTSFNRHWEVLKVRNKLKRVRSKMKNSLDAFEYSDAFDEILLRQNRRQMDLVVDQLQRVDLRPSRAAHVRRGNFLSVVVNNRVYFFFEEIFKFCHFSIQIPWPFAVVENWDVHSLDEFSMKKS